MESLRIDVIVPAAGVGKRMQLSIPKQYAKIGKLTVLEHTVYALLKCPYVNKVIVGVSDTDEYFDSLEISSHPQVIKGIGGKERSDTVRLNMDKVTTEYVMVHDAARPLISSKIISSNIEACKKYDAVDTVIKATDTIIVSKDNETLSSIPNRSELYQGQTPQSFKLCLILEAHEKAKSNLIPNVTDDCKLVLSLGKEVHLVEGSVQNFKITTFDDLMILKALLKLGKSEVL